jgi:hypothetical protein
MTKINLDGKEVQIKRIASGAFSKVYRGDDGLIYACNIITDSRELESSKEAIALFVSKGKHIPNITYHGDVYIPRLGYCYVYSMPEYSPLSGEAKNQAKLLNRLWKEFLADNYSLMIKISGYEFSHKVIEFFRGKIDECLRESIIDIVDATASYGDSYRLEFPLQNLKQDSKGNLILLDIIFNHKALKRR